MITAQEKLAEGSKRWMQISNSCARFPTATSFLSSRPIASANGRLWGGSGTRYCGGTVRSIMGHPQEHLPWTRTWSSCGRNARASEGAASRSRCSAIALSASDRGLSSSSVVAALDLRKRSSMLNAGANRHCAMMANELASIRRRQTFSDFVLPLH